MLPTRLPHITRAQALKGLGLTRQTALLLTMSLLAACSSDGCGCDGFEARPFPPEHYDKTTPQLTQIRLTPSGLQFVEDNLQPIINEAVPGGLNFCLPKDDQLCFPNRDGVQPRCADGSEGCQINLSIDGADLVPVPNSRLEVNILIGNVNPTIPFQTDVPIFGQLRCDVTAYKRGASLTTPATIKAKLPVDFSIDQNSPLKDTRLKLGELQLDLSDVDFDLRGGIRCGTLDALRGLFRSTIENLLKQQLKETVEDLQRENLCQACGADEPPCPGNSTCSSDQVCMYNNAQECVPRLLGVEGRLMLGSLLEDFTETPEAAADLTLRLADYANVDDGVSLAMRGGFQPTQLERCVPVDPSKRPPFTAIPISRTIMSNTKPVSGQPFMMGIGVHKRTVEQLLWSVWASGATCLSVDSQSVDLLSTQTLSLVVRSLRELADNERRAVQIKIVPQQPPSVQLGANTVEEVDGKLVIKDGLLIIDWKDFDLNMYGYVQDRHALLFTVRADLLLPVAILPGADGKLQVALGDLDKALTNVRILNHELLRESPDTLKETIPTLLGLALPQLASSLSDLSFDLPEIFGFRVTLNQGDITSVDDRSFIALFANLEPVAMSSMSALRAVQTQIHSAQVHYPQVAPGKMVRPQVTLALGAKVPGLDWPLPEHELEFSVRVNGGFWSLFQPTASLTIQDPVLALPGDHLIEVIARPRGVVQEADRSPAQIKVRVDYTSPELRIEPHEDPAHALRFVALDDVDPAHALTYRWRLHDGTRVSDWSAWSGEAALAHEALAERAPQADRVRVEVQARDLSGHVGRADYTLTPRAAAAAAAPLAPVSQAPEASLGCAQAPAPRRSPAGLGLLALLGLGLWSRRRRAPLAALASLLGLATVSSACTDDAASQKSACEPACVNGQVCKGGACVDADNRCDSDTACSDGQVCIQNLCVAPQCSTNAECRASCPDDKRGVCASGRCACEDYCPGGCGEGELCCFPSNSCKPVPDACEGKVCEPGYAPQITQAGSPDGATCGLVGAVCECVELPPLPLGVHGRYPDVDVHQGKVAVSAYNQTYQDLMVGVLDAQRQPVWQFVDGVPASGDVRGSLNGPRGGLATPGPRVGAHTALTFDDAGDLHVFYQDEDQRKLKYARGKASAQGFSFERITLAEQLPGQAGLFTRAIWQGGQVHVVYTTDLASSGEGQPARAQVRHLSFSPQEPLAELAQRSPTLVVEGAASRPCAQRCSGGAVCVIATGQCASPTMDCASCAEGSACVSGACVATAPDLAAGTPTMTGAFLDLSATDGGLLLVYYDGEQQSVAWTELTDAWQMPQYLGTPSGPYASGLKDGQGVIHLAYMDEQARVLRYEQVGQTPERVVDGLRDTGSQWIISRVGEDVTLRLRADGAPQVVYHDATLHQLMEATRQGNGQWSVKTLAQPGQPYVGEHGFYATLTRRSGAVTVVDYVINNQSSPPTSQPRFYTLP